MYGVLLISFFNMYVIHCVCNDFTVLHLTQNPGSLALNKTPTNTTLELLGR